MKRENRSIPVRKDVVRGRNPGHAAFGRGFRSPEDAVAEIGKILKIDVSSIPFQDRWLTYAQANQLGLTTGEKICEATGYGIQTWYQWRREFGDIPQPVAVLIRSSDASERPYLFQAAEVAAWLQAKRRAGLIYRPHKKRRA